MKNKKGQVWLETVLYTIIGLVIMALVLSVAYPKINAAREKILIEQSADSLLKLDEAISLVEERGEGNVKTYELTMKKGEFYVNSTGDEIRMVISGLQAVYSELGQEVKEGRVNIYTEAMPKGYRTTLTVRYNLDIKYDGEEVIKKFNQAVSPYSFSVRNSGIDNNKKKSIISIQNTNV